MKSTWVRPSGAFLAGLAPDGQALGCDDNLFEENDGSLSPNIAFEATFCRGNVFRDNYADHSNYGFWLGFSWDTVVENNRIARNRQAGIAVENGHGFSVRGNRFRGNGHGLLIWTRPAPPLTALFSAHETSHRWTVEGNVFKGNGTGVRIAADQDHGVRALPAGQTSEHISVLRSLRFPLSVYSPNHCADRPATGLVAAACPPGRLRFPRMSANERQCDL